MGVPKKAEDWPGLNLPSRWLTVLRPGNTLSPGDVVKAFPFTVVFSWPVLTFSSIVIGVFDSWSLVAFPSPSHIGCAPWGGRGCVN